MRYSNLSIAIMLILSSPVSVIHAEETNTEEKQEQKTEKKKSDNSVFELGDMIIKGEALKKLNSRDILSSVDIMNADKIENQNVLPRLIYFIACQVYKLPNSTKAQQQENCFFVVLTVKLLV